MEASGCRGLRGGSSLARLLARQRGVPPYRAQRTLSVEQILAWADAYHERTGCWPKCSAERIRGTRMRWSHVNRALRGGLYGLPRAFSLARLLEERRGVPRYLSGRPPLTEEHILAWADAYRARTGQWPTRLAGRIAGEARETWRGVDFALMYGRRGLPAGSTLNRFLAAHRPGPPAPRCTEEQILAWADAYRARTGQWPKASAGGMVDGPDGTPLRYGKRGLPGGSSLFQLLARCRGLSRARPRFTVAQILAWADAHHRRTGVWPHRGTGAIDEAPEVTWICVDRSLKGGFRGLPGGSSLARLLARCRGVPDPRRRPVKSRG